MNKIVDGVALNLQAMSFIMKAVEEQNGDFAFHSAVENLQNRKRKSQRIRDQSTVISIV